MNTYTLSDIASGLEAEFTASFKNQDVEDFARISGDINPLHTDKDFATKQGYKDCVVHGLLTSSLYSKLVGLYLPGRYALLQQVNASFRSPVFVGDTLTVFGRVTSVHQVLMRIEVRANIRNQNHTIVSKATIMVGINE